MRIATRGPYIYAAIDADDLDITIGFQLPHTFRRRAYVMPSGINEDASPQLNTIK